MNTTTYSTDSTANAPTLSVPAQNLQRLFYIRCLVILFLVGALASSYLLLSQPLPLSLNYPVLSGILLLIITINVMTFVRLQPIFGQQRWPVTEQEFFSHLFIDVISLGAFLYFSGGAGNPFISYFLVPICIAATTLSWTHTWALTGVALLIYTLLLMFYIPLPMLEPAHQHGSAVNPLAPNLHILGMWCNFAISATLITYFVVKMAKTLRERENELNILREDDLRNEQLMAVATLAAGTAHELGTPLSTMKVLINEMQSDYNDADPALGKDLQLLEQQLNQCTGTLRHLVNKAEIGSKETRGGENFLTEVSAFCNETLERWQVMRPDTSASIHINDKATTIRADIHPTIMQSIINLLNNAADANPKGVEITVDWNREQLAIDITDHGPGIPLDIAEQLGKPFLTTKGKGLGLGLFLTHATVSRYGGTVKLYNREQGGTLTELRLPLKAVTDTPISREESDQSEHKTP